MGRKMDRQPGRQIDRHRGRQVDRQMVDRQIKTNRQFNRWIETKFVKRIGRYLERHISRYIGRLFG